MTESLPRRRFLQTALGTTVAFSLPRFTRASETPGLLRIGLIADIHKDLVPNADERMQQFIDAMNEAKVDAIIQMGDFCTPKPTNLGFLEIFNSFQGPKHHVIGNHEMDGGFTREQVVSYLGMSARYHSFDLGGYHFILLDSNDRPEGNDTKYPSSIAADQVAWLKKDLAKTELPTFIFTHQSLEMPRSISNQEEIRSILEAEKLAGGARKVVACLNGHHHIDYHREIAEIPYLHINSASYFWMGPKYQRPKLSPELAKLAPKNLSAAPYKTPLFTILEIDTAAGVFRTRGMKSSWLGPSPHDLQYANPKLKEGSVAPEIRAVEGQLS